MKNYYLLVASFLMGNLVLQAQSYEWGGAFGGIGEDVVRAMAVDDQGNSYITGYYTDISDLDPTEEEFILTSNGFFDIFIQKIDPDGNLIWVKSIGADFFDYGTGVEVDAAGNVYVTGIYQQTVDFDPSEDSDFELTSTGGEDIFVLKLDSNGDFIWAKSMGSPGYEESVSVGIDEPGNVYVGGYFSEPVDFDPGEDENIITSNGGQDAFVVKLDESGNFLWAGNMGGSNTDLCLGMDVSPAGDVFVTGSFDETADFDPGIGTTETTSIGQSDAFVTKLNALGEHIFTATSGGTGADIGWDIALDESGNAFITGGFRGEFETGIPEPVESAPGSENVFVSKVNPFGALEWSATFLGNAFANGYDLNTDPEGNVIVAGYFANQIDFDPGVGDFTLIKESTEPFDAFVAKLNSNGEFMFAGNFGGSNFTEHHGVDTDAEGNIYLAAAFQNTVDINPTDGENLFSVAGFRDSYIFKLAIEETLNLAETELDEFRIYPNPATAFIQAENLSGLSYRIIDLSGRVIDSGIIQTSRISILDLPQGVYLFVAEGFQPSKFIKQ